MGRHKTLTGTVKVNIILDADRVTKLTELGDRHQLSRSYLIRQAIDQLYSTLNRTAPRFPLDRAP